MCVTLGPPKADAMMALEIQEIYLREITAKYKGGKNRLGRKSFQTAMQRWVEPQISVQSQPGSEEPRAQVYIRGIFVGLDQPQLLLLDHRLSLVGSNPGEHGLVMNATVDARVCQLEDVHLLPSSQQVLLKEDLSGTPAWSLWWITDKSHHISEPHLQSGVHVISSTRFWED